MITYLADALAPSGASQEETYEVVERLEDAGLRVGTELGARDPPWMREVLASARRLSRSLGRAPSVDEVAADSGKPAPAVRRALAHVAAFKPTS